MAAKSHLAGAAVDPYSSTSAWVRYGTAVISTGVALIFTLLVPHTQSDPIFALFIIGIAISTWIGGLRPGLLACLLTIIAIAIFVHHTTFWNTVHDIAQFVFFLATALFLMWLINVLQRSRQQLRNNENRIRTLAEAVPQMLWSTDPSGNADYLSRQWLDYTGQTLEEGMRDGWQNVLHPDERDRVSVIWRNSVQSKTIYEVECRLRRSDGMFRWMLARGVPLFDKNGNVTEWFGSCTDIHEQKIAEGVLRRAEKLAAAGRLASTMAHEINNPLASVTNLLYLAKTDPALPDGPCRGYLAHADQELARVTHMVDLTLGFFGGNAAPALVSIPEIVNELLAIYAGKITAKKVHVERRFDENLEVRAVRGELRQVFANLLANAIDVSPMQGKIHLRAYAHRDFTFPERRGITVTVADQGPGISPADRPNLFEPFFTTKKDVGTGLGLWASKRVIERWDGRIRFRSSAQPGRSGTVFSIFLPAIQIRAQSAPSSDSQ